MPTVAEFVSALAQRTQPENTPDWDPVGLQLGEPSSEVVRIGVCHEVTEEVVAEVESNGMDLLLAYHPLLFVPTRRVIGGRSPGARAFRLISAGVAVVVTHTDFDAAPGGTADSLADVFNLRDVEEFGDDPDTGLAAIGRVGSFEGSLDAVDAIATDAFGVSGLRVSGDRDRSVGRLAVVPGSGGSLVAQAAGLADALVTGDVSHHTVVSALDSGLSIVDPGHVATERPGMAALVSLAGDISGLEVTDLTGLDPQTWS